MRICTLCVIRFDVDSSDESKNCPKCGNSQFLTISTESSNLFHLFNESGDTLDRYLRYEPDANTG